MYHKYTFALKTKRCYSVKASWIKIAVNCPSNDIMLHLWWLLSSLRFILVVAFNPIILGLEAKIYDLLPPSIVSFLPSKLLMLLTINLPVNIYIIVPLEITRASTSSFSLCGNSMFTSVVFYWVLWLEINFTVMQQKMKIHQTDWFLTWFWLSGQEK